MGASSRNGSCGDRISSLPDDLIIVILIHLRSAAAAARTSVLSHRWRGIFAHLPELFLKNLKEPVLDSVDAALAAYSGRNLRRLEITFPNKVDAGRLTPWLRFASQRLAGELSLDQASCDEVGQELELLPCERVTTMDLCLKCTLRLPRDSSFPALAVLTIGRASMEARDLERLGSSRWFPRLRELLLCGVKLATVSDVSIRSEILERLVFLVKHTRRLQVVAPRLQVLRVHSYESEIAEGYIVAPKLAEVFWWAYDPQRHQFVGAGRHLRLLSLRLTSMVALMQRFDTVDRLVINLPVYSGKKGYESFMKAMCKPAKCETLDVDLSLWEHDYAPILLHLLRKSSGLRKIVVRLPRSKVGRIDGDICRLSGCPCCSPENFKIDNISLESLEEVEIVNFGEEDYHVDLLSLLLGCNAAILKIVVINVAEYAPFVRTETYRKIRTVASQNTDVKFEVYLRGRRMPYMLG